MDFSHVERTTHPRSLVFRTHRDRLPEVIAHLDTVRAVSQRSRTEHAGGIVELSHRWEGTEAALPALIRPFVPPQLLIWHEVALWDRAQWLCEWTIEVPALGPVVTIAGVNRFDEGPTGCDVAVQGAFTFHPERIPQLPQLPPAAVPFIERFVVALILPMLRQSGRAVAALLEAERA